MAESRRKFDQDFKEGAVRRGGDPRPGQPRRPRRRDQLGLGPVEFAARSGYLTQCHRGRGDVGGGGGGTCSTSGRTISRT